MISFLKDITKNVSKFEWVSFVLYATFLIAFFKPSIAVWSIPMLFVYVAVYQTVRYPIVKLVNKIRGTKVVASGESLVKRMVRSVVEGTFTLAKSFVIIFGLVFPFLMVYLLQVNPFTLEKHVITDGKKTVVFQEMQHLSTEKFYEEVKNDITGYKNDGYSILLEGVRAKNKENAEKFNSIVGFTLDVNTYANMEKTFGLKSQDMSYVLSGIGGTGSVNGKNVRIADVYLDDIIKDYESKYGAINVEANKKNVVELGSTSDVMENTFSEFGLKAIKWVFLTEMNINRIPGLTEVVQQKLMGKSAYYILPYRNDNLAKEILNDTNDKVYVNYGMLHFDGVLELLQKQNPEWKVVSQTSKNVLPTLW